jgi:prolipoprotein diacylglyceryltransferase
MLPYLQIGPLSLPVPALALLLSIWLGLELAEKHANRYGLNPAQIYNLILAGIIGAVIGARLSYVITYSSIFLADPLSILSPNPSLLDPWGAAGGAALSSLIFGQRRRLPLWPTLDALTPFMAVVMVGVGVMHFASGDAFGAPTQLPWGVLLWGEIRHPTQIYEVLAALAITGLWRLSHRASLSSGQTFLAFVALSSLAHLFIEGFRGDSVLLPYGLRLAQVLAWVILAAALYGFSRRSVATHQPSGAISEQSKADHPLPE